MKILLKTSIVLVLSLTALTAKQLINFNGFVMSQFYVDSNNQASGNQLNHIAGESKKSKNDFAFDASRFNFSFSEDSKISGRFEFDLQEKDYFRIRHAWVKINLNNLYIGIGQTNTLVGNLTGPYLFNNDWFFAAGNAYDRMQQFQIGSKYKKIDFKLAVVKNFISTALVDSDQLPHVQARINYNTSFGVLGISSLYGQTKVNGVSGNLNSYLGSIDGRIKVLKNIELGFQLWYSQSAALGTGSQINNQIYTVNGGTITGINAYGGFLEVHSTFKKLNFAVAFGDNISDQASSTLKHNLTTGINVSYNFTKNTVLSLEYQFMETYTSTYKAQDHRMMLVAKHAFSRVI